MAAADKTAGVGGWAGGAQFYGDLVPVEGSNADPDVGHPHVETHHLRRDRLPRPPAREHVQRAEAQQAKPIEARV